MPMDSSSTNFSSSTTPTKDLSLLMPQGYDENDENFQETGKGVKKPNKQTAMMKHFMTPTISAASKVNPSIKKILAERNETVGTHPQKTNTSSGEFAENEQNCLVDDLSSKPHNPSTNYPSPRPKFLRYNPNRRREMFLQRENENLVQGECGSTAVGSGCLSSPHGSDEGDLGCSCDTVDGNMVQESEELVESDDEFEEVVEETGWGFKTVLKYLLFMAVLVLSTAYISSMNSPAPSPIVQAVMGLNDGYHMVQDHVYGFVKSLRSGSCLMLENEEIGLGFRDTDEIEEEIGAVEWAEAESSEEVYEVVEAQSREALRVVEAEKMEGIYEFGDSNGIVGENGGKDAPIIVENEEKEYIVEDEQMEAFDELTNAVKLASGETVSFVEHEEVKEGEDSCDDQVAVDPELQAQLLIAAADNQDLVSAAPGSFEKKKDVINELLMEETAQVEMVKVGSVYDEQPRQEEDYTDEIDQDSSSEAGLITKYMETEPILKAVIGFTVVSSFIASLALALRSKRKRRSRKDTSRVVEHYFEKRKSAIAGNVPPLVFSANLKSVIPEKDTSVIENGKTEHIQPFARFPDTKYLNNSMEEETEKHQNRAPLVEFLGEFEVGEMSSSSLRSRGLKSKMMIDAEVSNHYVSTKKVETFGRAEPIVGGHLYPDVSEIPMPNSASSSRSAFEKKVAMKEERVTTPVRRSSRISNRVMSPR